MQRTWRYQTRLVVGLLAVAVPVTAIVVLVLTGAADDSLERSVGNLLTARARAVAHNVATLVEERRADSHAGARAVGGQAALRGGAGRHSRGGGRAGDDLAARCPRRPRRPVQRARHDRAAVRPDRAARHGMVTAPTFAVVVDVGAELAGCVTSARPWVGEARPTGHQRGRRRVAATLLDIAALPPFDPGAGTGAAA